MHQIATYQEISSSTLELQCLLQDLELPSDLPQPSSARASEVFVAPNPGLHPSQKWIQKCKLAAEHVAAGSFETAMRLLSRCSFSPSRQGELSICLAV